MGAAVAAAALTAVAGCSSIDCPLNHTVSLVSTLDGDTLTDTLTISTTRRDGSDSVLINRQLTTTAFALPMSFDSPADVFFIDRGGIYGGHSLDTLTVYKEDHPHFEAVDCSPAFFHTVTAATITRHGIDSVTVVNPNVNYDPTHAHLKIYFKRRLR